MDPKQVAKQMIAFNKAAFDNNFKAMTALYEQTERMISKFWEKSPMFPEEGKKVISEWLKTYKSGCENFKKTVDENFKKVEEYFNKTA
jgi:polyhydroxyalkanoate synthesis regulator phasin